MTVEALEKRENQAAVVRGFRHGNSSAIDALCLIKERGITRFLDMTHPTRQSTRLVGATTIAQPLIPAEGQTGSLSPTVSISMFNPNLTPELVQLAQGILGPEIRLMAAYSSPKACTLFESDSKRKKEWERKLIGIKRRMNRKALRYVQDALGAATQKEALTLFQEQASQADNAVRYHDAQLYPEDATPAIPDIVASAKTPAALASAYFSSDPEVRFAAQRKMLLTLTSIELEKVGRQGADRKLEQIHDLLEWQLFESSPQAAKEKIKYGIVNNETNEVVELLGDPPTEPAPPGQHYKRFTPTMRRIMGTDLDGLLMIGKKAKDSAISKVLFKAKKRADESKKRDVEIVDDAINPTDVDDSHRLMVVVDGTDEDAEKIRQKVGFILIGSADFLSDRDKEGNLLKDSEGNIVGTVIDVTPRDNPQQYNGSGDKLGHKRITVTFAGYKAKLEVIVKSLQRDINYYQDIGTVDAIEGKISGLAHDPFKIIKRAPGVDEIMHPESVFPYLPRPYRRGPDGTFPPHPVLEKILFDLCTSNIFEPARELISV